VLTKRGGGKRRAAHDTTTTTTTSNGVHDNSDVSREKRAREEPRTTPIGLPAFA
jgi:hypothetical protein